MVYNRVFNALIFLLLISSGIFAQASYQIGRPCPGLNANPSAVTVTTTQAGDVNLVPCFGGTVQIGGAPIGPGLLSLNALTASAQFLTVAANDTASWSDSVATHQLRLPITAITGSSRTNFFPNFTTANTFGKSPFSWNGTLFNWQNTALNNTLLFQYTPTRLAGIFHVGDNVNADFNIDEATGVIGFVSGGGFNVDTKTSAAEIGDVNGIGTQTLFILNDATSSISLFAAAGVALPAQTPKAILTLNTAGVVTSNLLTNGQIPIGATGSNPVMAAITAGTGISVTNGAGSITIANDGTAPLSSVLASDFTNATATFANTTLSVPVAASGTYAFTLQAFISDSVAAEGGKIDFAGGSATFTNFIAGSNSVLVTTVTNANTGTFSNATITGTNLITISGTTTINAGGTFIVRAAQVAHVTGTLTLARGSRLMLNKL